MSAAPQRIALPVAPAYEPAVLLRVESSDVRAADAVVVRRAVAADVEAMHALQAEFVASRILLARSIEQIRATIDHYVVAEADGAIVATGMLKVYSADLAEVCALAVAPAYQKHGLGRRIVHALLDDAQAQGIHRVIALTLQDKFFHRLGFTTTALSRLPEKVAADCKVCPKRHACDEIAVVREVAPTFSNTGRS
ncbi:MAG TPA: GNAT family N-acetyltransferase [Longimicrobiales bacterium]|nr:GNAT family N-acetyltransferase [Longimicrobiales bacterium]